jgi:hypothetical protein
LLACPRVEYNTIKSHEAEHPISISQFNIPEPVNIMYKAATSKKLDFDTERDRSIVSRHICTARHLSAHY